MTSEGDDGTTHPAEQLWTPSEDAVENGFIVHVLRHQWWADIIEAPAAYMARVHGWRNLHLYSSDAPAVLIPRILRAVLTHGVFLRHPITRTTPAAASGTTPGAWSGHRLPSPVPSRCPGNRRWHPEP